MIQLQKEREFGPEKESGVFPLAFEHKLEKLLKHKPYTHSYPISHLRMGLSKYRDLGNLMIRKNIKNSSISKFSLKDKISKDNETHIIM